jgi:ABC-type transport system involved in multi-copper enzyme maturation permease subunit
VRKIYSVALNTFRESVREKLFYLVIIYAMALVVSVFILSPLSVGAAKGKIVTDVGLAGISILGILTAIIVGSNLVHKEMDRKAILMVLTRPVSRTEYLIGKFAGVALSLLVLIGIMTAVLVVMMLLGGAELTPAVFFAVGLSLIEIGLIVAVMIFFSTFTTPLLTSFFTICIFVAGTLSGDLRLFAQKFGGRAMNYVMDVLYFTLPNLKVFNLRHEAVHGLRYSTSEILLPAAYGIVYTAAMLYFAWLVFRRREFS